MFELHVIFQGKVQGVGFRASARRKALELGLTGTVRNLKNGSVELIAQGKEEQLKTLLQYLHDQFDIVESKQEFRPVTQSYRGFDFTLH